jgi:hypothetical protein
MMPPKIRRRVLALFDEEAFAIDYLGSQTALWREPHVA